MRARLVGFALLAACTTGAPPGFEGGKGDRWTFPLVGPMEDELLVTPVSINGRGPFLFAIDPDANVSILDEAVAKKLELPVHKGPRRLDESDTQQPRFYADAAQLELGSLIALQHTLMIIGEGAYDANGRRISGVLGRDILADSVVFGFDRDHGLGYLTTVKAFTPPPTATKLGWQRLDSRIENADVKPIPRRLVGAKIGDASYQLHVDLGASHSQLRETAWKGLATQPLKNATIDEVGSVRRTEHIAIAPLVTVGAITGKDLALQPFGDRRWSDDIDGTLGLDFFRAYSLWLHWDAKALFVAPRTPVAAKQRIARWEDDVPTLARCKNVACMNIRLVDPMAGKPLEEGKPHPGVVLIVEREEIAGGLPFELLLEAKDRPDAPLVLVNLPAGAARAMQQLKGEFVGTTFEVVDASPFPRVCPSANAACVDLLAR